MIINPVRNLTQWHFVLIVHLIICISLVFLVSKVALSVAKEYLGFNTFGLGIGNLNCYVMIFGRYSVRSSSETSI